MKRKEIHPDCVIYRNGFKVDPVGDTRAQEAANIALSIVGAKRRFRSVVHEDRVVAAIFSTQKQAERVVDDLVIGEDGNFHLPT